MDGRRFFPAVGAAFLLFAAGALGQSAAASAAKSKAPQPGDEFVIAIHTQIPLELQSAISSRTAYVGMPVYCRTLYPVTMKDRMVIPVGSYVKGTITQVVRPGHVKGKARIGIRFDSLILPSGVTKDISGVLAGFAGNGNQGFKRQEGQIIGEGTKGKDAETVLISGAEGAGIGSVAGISGGHSGAGAAMGGTVGAVGGLIWVLATRGKEIVLRPGTDFQLETTRPITFYRYQIEPLPDPNGPNFPKRYPGPAM
ncbi:MAG: hypothetical protein KGM47_04850 [Acidobacteriota bacterium]|nr:hypothetical protein [Acidobacteriota bacterium]